MAYKFIRESFKEGVEITAGPHMLYLIPVQHHTKTADRAEPILWQKQRIAVIKLHIFPCLVVLKRCIFAFYLRWNCLICMHVVWTCTSAFWWRAVAFLPWGGEAAPSDSVWIKFTCLLSIHFTTRSFPLKNKSKQIAKPDAHYVEGSRKLSNW